MTQQPFGHLAARGIAGTEYQHAFFSLSLHDVGTVATARPSCSTRARSTPAGFVARMKALMNLPSTCGAIASTSMPLPARNARASSTRRCASARSRLLETCAAELGACIRHLRSAPAMQPTHSSMFCADLVGHVAADHHIRHRESSAGLQHAERLAEHSVLVRRKIDHAIGNDHVHASCPAAGCARSRP